MTKISDEFIRLYDMLEEAYSECKKEIEPIAIDNPERDQLLTEKVHEYGPTCRNPMFKLGQVSVDFTEQEREAHQQWVQTTEHWKGIQESPFCRRIINKPEGYPGDYKLMNMIYSNGLEGESNWGKFIHKQALESETPQAVRNRRKFLREEIFELNRGGRILSVAAGPVKEIEDVLTHPTNNHNYDFMAIDHDINALRYVKSKIGDNRLNYGIANAFHIIKENYSVAFPRPYALRQCNPQRDFKGIRKLAAPFKYRIENLAESTFDLVYSAGLYDYIRTFEKKEKGATALTKSLFQLLKPGGKLLIGNFSPNNPLDLRFSMELLYDWVLIYRDKNEMHHLADGIPEGEISKMTLLEEPLGINYFLKIVKRG